MVELINNFGGLFLQLVVYVGMLLIFITKLKVNSDKTEEAVARLEANQEKTVNQLIESHKDSLNDIKCDIKTSKEERQRELEKLESYIDKKFDRYDDLVRALAVVENSTKVAHHRIDKLEKPGGPNGY